MNSQNLEKILSSIPTIRVMKATRDAIKFSNPSEDKKLSKILPKEFEYSSTKKYYYVSGSAQEIYFDGSKKSIRLLQNILKLRPNIKKKVFLKILPYWKYNPLGRKVELPFNVKENLPGNLVLVSNRAVSIDFNSSKVTRLNICHPCCEKDFRTELDEIGVTVPKIIDTGDKYVQEELIEGLSRLESLEGNEKALVNSYSELIKFYQYRGVETTKEGLFTVKAHGDFHIGNLGRAYNKTFIFDWEDRRREPLYYDLIYFLWLEYKFEDIFYRRQLERLSNKAAQDLGVPKDKKSMNILNALEALMTNKNSRKAEKFSQKVKQTYE